MLTLLRTAIHRGIEPRAPKEQQSEAFHVNGISILALIRYASYRVRISNTSLEPQLIHVFICLATSLGLGRDVEQLD